MGMKDITINARGQRMKLNLNAQIYDYGGNNDLALLAKLLKPQILVNDPGNS